MDRYYYINVEQFLLKLKGKWQISGSGGGRDQFKEEIRVAKVANNHTKMGVCVVGG